MWWEERDLNPYARRAADFESAVATITPSSQKWWLLRDLNSQAQRAADFKSAVYADSTKKP